MSEISSINFHDASVPSAAQLNTPQRKGAADIAVLFSALMTGDQNEAAAADGILGGLQVQGVNNDMRVLVTKGAGFRHDATAVAGTPPDSWELLLLAVDTHSSALSDGDGTHPRIDVISVDPSSAELDSEAVLNPGSGAGTTPRYTRRGPQLDIVVTEGTPAASPSAPSTPSGHVKLAEVTIPAGLTAGGGGTGDASVTITDYRNHAGLYKRRNSGISAEAAAQLIKAAWSGSDIIARSQIPDGSNSLSLQLDADSNWLFLSRNGVPAGEEGSDLYPLVSPGGRGWEIYFPVPLRNPAEAYTVGANWTVTHNSNLGTSGNTKGPRDLLCLHNGSGAQNLDVEIPITLPQRGLKITAVTLHYEVNTILGGSGAATARVYKVSGPGQDQDAIGSETTLNNTTGLKATAIDVGGGSPPEDEITEDHTNFVLAIRLAADAVADSASIEIYGVTVEVEEGWLAS